MVRSGPSFYINRSGSKFFLRGRFRIRVIFTWIRNPTIKINPNPNLNPLICYTLWKHFWDTQYKHIFLFFCHLLKKYSGNQYLKFVTLLNFFADTTMNFFYLVLLPIQSTFGRPSTKYSFCFNQKNLFTNPSWNNF